MKKGLRPIEQPQAVLLDRAGNALVYVFRSAVPDEARRAKAFVRANYRHRVTGQGEVKRRTVVTNAVRTTGYVDPASFRGTKYELIWGDLDD